MTLRISAAVLASWLAAAHFSRVRNDALALALLLTPLLLFARKRWILRVFQILALMGAGIWMERALFLARQRQEAGAPWLRLVIILSAVALFTLLVAWLLQSKNLKTLFSRNRETATASISAFFLTFGLLGVVHLKVRQPVLLLAERFIPGAGWAEILLIAFYAGWIAEKLSASAHPARTRMRIWLFFSIVFFCQLLLGLAGAGKMLMTGTLHLPVPAVIIAGPVFRGEGFFMLFLFFGALLLLGAGWCSHLCYIGAWDNVCASGKRTPAPPPPAWKRIRLGLFAGVIVMAAILRITGTPSLYATRLAAVFGISGVGVMGILSRRAGVMVHCTAFCPLGLAANFLGRLNPFRLTIGAECTQCLACRAACRYQALEKHHIINRRPGLTCSLCGDCLPSCREGALSYSFLRLSPAKARTLFIAIAAALHAVFLATARL